MLFMLFGMKSHQFFRFNRIITLVLFLGISLGMNNAIGASDAPTAYKVYRYISPEGRLIFSTEKKSKPYIRLRQIPEGWVPENELSLYRGDSKKNATENYSLYIRNAANRYHLPYYLLHAIITVESAYDHRAISTAGAQGLMQLMPATARRFEVNDPYNAKQNINGGSRYLRYLLGLFNGNLRLALAAYNAGENAVIKHGNRIPPYKETQNYVQKVLLTYRKYRFSSPPD